MSRNGGTLGGGWVHLKGANSMAASGLGYRKALDGTGWANIVRMEAPQGQKSVFYAHSCKGEKCCSFPGLHGQSLAESHEY